MKLEKILNLGFKIISERKWSQENQYIERVCVCVCE